MTYEPVTCFMIVPTDRAKVSLRRYRSSRKGPPCSAPTGYHNAFMALQDAHCELEPWSQRFGAPSDGVDTMIWHVDAPDEPPHNDRRWPTHCTCGYAFVDDDEWQVLHETIWRAVDGREFGERSLPPGAMRDVAFMGKDGFMPKPSPDGKALYVVLPCRHEWFIDGPANNGPMGWTRTGSVPRITVSPSVQCGGSCYHGWLRDGVLTSV